MGVTLMRSYLKNCANIKNYTRITIPVSKGYLLFRHHAKPYVRAQKDNPTTGSYILLRYPEQKVLLIILLFLFPRGGKPFLLHGIARKQGDRQAV
jgi:hypothetical protein